LDLSVGELVAEDHREVSPVPRGRFELLAELALAELGPGRDPGCTQDGRDPEPVGGRGRVRPDDDGDRRGLDERRRRLRLEREEDPVEAEPEADPRRRLAAEELDESVIAAPAAEGGLLARDAARVDLEGGPRVVVETADEVRLEAIGH